MVQNTFDVKTTLYTQFHETPTGETECFEDSNVGTCTEDIVYTAYCMHNVAISIVDLWFTGNYLDGGGDSGVVPECCHPSNTTNPTVQYTFKLRCESECPPRPGTPTAAPVTPTASPVTPTASPVTLTAAPVPGSPSGAPVTPVTPTFAPVTGSPTGAPVSRPDCEKVDAETCSATDGGATHEVSIETLGVNLTDNSYSEWTLSNGIDMWTAGNSDKATASKAYVTYDCAAKTLCVLVVAEDGKTLDKDDLSDNNWIKIYDDGPSNAESGTIQQIKGTDGTRIIAWEGCFENIAPACAPKVQIHANYDEGETTSTGKGGALIALNYQCECTRRRRLKSAKEEEHLSSYVANFLEDKKKLVKKNLPHHGGDSHYCSKDEYPCGEINENVHVCHYSARDGYQTYCVPEADSDILGYYPKDYCGHCVGGYRRARS